MNEDLSVQKIYHILYHLLIYDRVESAKKIVEKMLGNNETAKVVLYLFNTIFYLVENNESKAKSAINQAIQFCKSINESQKIVDLLNSRVTAIEILNFIKNIYMCKDDNIIETYICIANECDLIGDLYGKMIFLKKILELNPNMFEAKLSLAFLLLGTSVGKASQTFQAETMFKELYKNQPDNIMVCFGLGRSALNIGKFEEALPFLKKAFEAMPENKYLYSRCEEVMLELGRYEDLNWAIQKALQCYPDDSHLNEMKKMTENYLRSQNKPKMARMPLRCDELSNLMKAANKFLFNMTIDPKFLINKNNKVITIGSCFATNIANVLNEKLIIAQSITIGELINSPYANLSYLKRVTGQDLNPITTQKLIDILGRDPVNDIILFKNANLVIFTLGVASCAFNKDGEFIMFEPGEFSYKKLNKEYSWRNTSVEENKRCIISIINILKSIQPNLKIFFTVSPVPLNCSFEYESAIVADCVSKSTLRASIDEVIRENTQENIFYWPAFELFRWLGSYSSGVYGADDGNSMHASEFAVEVAITSFIDKFFIS